MSARNMVQALRESGALGLPQRSILADNVFLLVPLALTFGAAAVLAAVYVAPNLGDIASFATEKKAVVVYAKPGEGRG